MRSPPLLALLLFIMVVRTTAQPLSTAPNRTLSHPHPLRSKREDNTPLMLELMGPNGGQRTLRGKKGGFLTEIVTPGGYRTMSIAWARMDGQNFTFEQINDYEVALRSRDGYYMSHKHLDFAGSVSVVKEPQILTPVKNSEGSWSFKSRWNKWMSSKRTAFSPDALFESKNTDHEHWWLESW